MRSWAWYFRPPFVLVWDEAIRACRDERSGQHFLYDAAQLGLVDYVASQERWLVKFHVSLSEAAHACSVARGLALVAD